MRLDSIATKNYRTLQDLTLVFSKHYCTISGRNNAGKSCVIRLLSGLFGLGADLPWLAKETDLDYAEDKTQWVKQPLPIEVVYTLSLTRDEDPALFSFAEVIASKKIESPSMVLCITYSTAGSNDASVSVTIDGDKVEEKAGKEIDKRIKDSNLLFLYNSTAHNQENIYLGRGRRRMFYDFVMSDAEKKILDEAGKFLEKKARSLAKQHTQNLSEVLGRLTERYEVAVSTPEGFGMRRMPLGVNLRDRNVEVPLNDWGSGTQNRTRILMAILQAKRIKTMGSPDEKVTPFVVIEEPESFLHPSAQAEFGRMLCRLSSEFGIQVIVTTHSPYMLNQEEPSANILLAREIKRKKPFATILVETSGDNWMAPFADHLGIGPEEFTSLRPLFSVAKSKVLLVEGQIDKEYFEFLKQHGLPCDVLANDIEVDSLRRQRYPQEHTFGPVRLAKIRSRVCDLRPRRTQ